MFLPLSSTQLGYVNVTLNSNLKLKPQQNTSVNDIIANRLTMAQIFFPKTKDLILKNDEPINHELELLRKTILEHRILNIIECEANLVGQSRDVERPKLAPLASKITRSSSGSFVSVNGNEEEIKIGAYTRAERRLKIKKFKEKLKRRRTTHPIVRVFEGRRKIAFAKRRHNGRFAKKLK